MNLFVKHVNDRLNQWIVYMGYMQIFVDCDHIIEHKLKIGVLATCLQKPIRIVVSCDPKFYS